MGESAFCEPLLERLLRSLMEVCLQQQQRLMTEQAETFAALGLGPPF
jgi:hypothetical protein